MRDKNREGTHLKQRVFEIAWFASDFDALVGKRVAVLNLLGFWFLHHEKKSTRILGILKRHGRSEKSTCERYSGRLSSVRHQKV